MRHIMFKINYIENQLKDLSNYYNAIKQNLKPRILTEQSYSCAIQYYQFISTLIANTKVYLKNDFLKNEFITEFSRNRVRQIRAQLTGIQDLLSLLFKLVSKFKNSNSNENFRFYIDLMIKNSMIKIKKYLAEPLSYFPDVNIWFLCNKEPVGVCTIKSRDLIHSSDEYKKGSICGRMVYTDVKSLKPADFDDPERANIARIRIIAWLGLINETESILRNEKELEHYRFSNEKINEYALPSQAYFSGKKFFFR